MTNLNCPPMVLVVAVHSSQVVSELDTVQMQFSVCTAPQADHLAQEQTEYRSVLIFRADDPIVFRDVFLVGHRSISVL